MTEESIDVKETAETTTSTETSFLPKIDQVQQKIILEKGSEILARMAGFDIKKPEEKNSYGVYFTDEEAAELEMWATDLARKKIIPRASVGSASRFMTLEYLKIINDYTAKKIVVQSEVSKGGQ